MIFGSPAFLFLFLPVVLLGYLLIRGRARNYWLLVASLLFYFIGERKYVIIMLVSVAGNHLFGRLIARQDEKKDKRRLLLAAIILNIGLLAFFKYANFIVESFNTPLAAAGLPELIVAPIHLPIGISFFTFQALSYVIDVYRGDAETQPRLANTALYISLFPQLIAGPIVRYHDIAAELLDRTVRRQEFAEGVRRFIIGLAKKMLIANPVALTADQIFALPADQLATPVAWLGAVCYTLQIYFDFSGYSDMAIGLGLMLGFHFPENFNYPYSSKSIREFWRRWHISLTRWFRDYLYIPLGGNRRSAGRTYLNLVIVYFLSGLWHGASWTFVIWGLYHGFFMVLERLGFERVLSRMWAPFRHLYALLVIVFGWVLFRSDTISGAWGYLSAMFGATSPTTAQASLAGYLSPGLFIVILVGLVVSVPIGPALRRRLAGLADRQGDGRLTYFAMAGAVIHVLFLLILFAGAILQLAADTYNPFIYFRF